MINDNDPNAHADDAAADNDALTLDKETLQDLEVDDARAPKVVGGSGPACQGDTGACPTIAPSKRANCV